MEDCVVAAAVKSYSPYKKYGPQDFLALLAFSSLMKIIYREHQATSIVIRRWMLLFVDLFLIMVGPA